MSFYKCTNTVDEDEDPIFIIADSQHAARALVYENIGPIPPSMLVFEEIPELPDGEEIDIILK